MACAQVPKIGRRLSRYPSALTLPGPSSGQIEAEKIKMETKSIKNLGGDPTVCASITFLVMKERKRTANIRGEGGQRKTEGSSSPRVERGKEDGGG